MKILVDIEALVRDRVITEGQAKEVRRRGTAEMVTLAVNLLLLTGIVAVVLGTSAFLNDAAAIAMLGAVVLGLGTAGVLWLGPGYRLLTNAAAVIGASMFLGGALWWAEEHFESTLPAISIGAMVAAIGYAVWLSSLSRLRFITGCLVVAGAAAHLYGVLTTQSDLGLEWLALTWAAIVLITCGGAINVRFVTALAIIPLATALSARSFYGFASYGIAIYEPTLTIVALGLLAVFCVWLTTQVSSRIGRHARILALLCLIWVDMAFWIGCLWGDIVGLHLWGPIRVGLDYSAWQSALRDFEASALVISADIFALTWALVLL